MLSYVGLWLNLARWPGERNSARFCSQRKIWASLHPPVGGWGIEGGGRRDCKRDNDGGRRKVHLRMHEIQVKNGQGRRWWRWDILNLTLETGGGRKAHWLVWGKHWGKTRDLALLPVRVAKGGCLSQAVTTLMEGAGCHSREKNSDPV